MLCAWDAALKKTGVNLTLLQDPDMPLMFERGTRGGVSMITKRYSKANNTYMRNYDTTKTKQMYYSYLDANNLYDWAMSKKKYTVGPLLTAATY